jgi:hypothetical protein
MMSALMMSALMMSALMMSALMMSALPWREPQITLRPGEQTLL